MPARVGRLRSLGRFAIVALGVVCAFAVNWSLDEALGWSRSAVIFTVLLAGVAAALGGLAYYLHKLGGVREVVLLLGVGAVVVGSLAGGAWTYRGIGHQLVSDYCRYGAVSTAQLDGCLSHVRPQQVLSLDTPAARFADGRSSTCGIGAGPFCAEAESRRYLDEAARDY